MRVQPGEGEDGQDDRGESGARRRRGAPARGAGRGECRGIRDVGGIRLLHIQGAIAAPPGAAGGEQAVRQEEQRSCPARDDDQPRCGGDHESESGDARDDQHGVGHRADDDDGQHVLAADPLTQHEHVLRTDGDDQREAEAETGKNGEHALRVGNHRRQHQRRFLSNH